MKKFAKVASLVATMAFAAQVNAATADAVNSKHVQNGTDNQIWTSGDYGSSAGNDKLCWQTGYYPDGNGVVGCDAQAPVIAAKPAVIPPTVTVGKTRLNFDAKTLFGFDQAVLRPEGQMMLGKLASALKSVSVGQTVVTGHTDSWGTDAYNDRLSLRRAEAVKAYLVSQGLAASKIMSKGMGERELIVSPAACKGTKAARQACEQPNRRVSIDIVDAVVPSDMVSKWQSALSAAGVNVKN
jgi:OmpA-OmpF porin, OOP family